jgi:hypothetical protein
MRCGFSTYSKPTSTARSAAGMSALVAHDWRME